MKNLEQNIIAWYETNKRDFPWRHTQNPYHIWICEIMSQQTQMSRVVDYYLRFLEIFPTLNDLATAEEKDLLKAWEGLGYYSRVRNMQVAAQQVQTDFSGKFPDTYDALLQLKGVGMYSAASIASIAFDQPVAAVDGNVLRVYSRLVELADDISSQKTKQLVKNELEKYVTDVNPSSFNQGMIELGATVCTPTSPFCLACPLQEMCAAYQHQTTDLYPIKKKKVKQKLEELYTFVIYDQNQQVYMIQERDKQFLHGLYALPQYPNNDNLSEVIEQLNQDTGLSLTIDSIEFKGMYKHVFSHKIWDMSVYVGVVQTKKQSDFVNSHTVAIANAHRKVID